MDELTIAGKRYISARRAAREHRYHSDYIGQLVRAEKIVGQKVGRSWYVEEESLLCYFNGENTPMVTTAFDTIPVIEKEDNESPSIEVPAEEEISPVLSVAEPLKIAEESAEEKIVEEPAIEMETVRARYRCASAEES